MKPFSPALMENVSESLAGRLGIVHMTPLILPELGGNHMDDLWLRGGYPDGGILNEEMFPEWQHDYLETLASRDLPTWGLPAKEGDGLLVTNLPDWLRTLGGGDDRPSTR